MINRTYHLIVAFVAVVVGGAVLGLAFSSVDTTRVVAFLLGGAWLILGALAWRESRKASRRTDRYRTPANAIYGLHPRMGEASGQYPRSHIKVHKKWSSEQLSSGS